MVREYEDKITSARFVMHVNSDQLKGAGLRKPTAPINTFIYNKGSKQKVKIDEIDYEMPERSLLPLVSNQNFTFEKPDQLIAWQFNREFYCIVDHDAEVGCVGFLFYGIEHPMFIKLNEDEKEEMRYLEKMFSDEWLSQDNFQGEMLRTLLKHLIIKTTRTAKQQSECYSKFSDEKLDMIRKFALLLEEDFKKEHGVKFYADALNKSPKTLSNIFAILRQPAPSKIIQNRIILEAKRYLHYTDKTAKEIAYELGFESPAHFSRFFKMYTGTNISKFRE
ncbi:helix-turn-helix domain-containing protein [Chryseobacterium sp. M5]|uniref:helix-turn-helix domain-containing protein n=1 Tax=Bacteroidota TaxID=976 RepID=UPI0008A11CB1|nr:helix-turn-helix domain-containing protein [Sphingobacterium sp. HMSC13C05]MBX2977302.1 AraC family transcriptional regulator [Ignavibacteriaceae bacterium]OFV19240.1 AraC family transcriptional regulator [Sphingobacterium sp. HMSC13C05]